MAATLALLGLAIVARSQYYYKDIILTAQISANYRLLKGNKVTKVSFGAFIQNQQVQDGINLEQTVNAQKNTVVTYTNTTASGESWLSAFYNESGLLVNTVDSSKETTSNTIYSYDAQNRITRISNTSVAKDNSTLTETHEWSYTAAGQAQKMVKIKNDSDTTFVKFTLDENGNVSEEQVTRNKYSLGTTHYYYDASHRLTDIARYNKRADRILPDYIFEYNDASQLTQMIVVPDGSSDYQTWKYTYNTQSLKQQEVCFNKQKQMVGKVEYMYEFK